jgi:glycosyltransferase involved in cell wall biosynthesis
MRIFTCTPRDFEGGDDFFSRDSGLLCRGLGMIGVESRVVMTGEPRDCDRAEVMRCKMADLESVEWWRGLKLDGVVLYSWGRAKYRHVAAAVGGAGIPLILNQDSGGVVSPLNGLSVWLRQQWHQSGQGKGLTAWRTLATRVLRGVAVGLPVTDPLRRMHLAHGKWIACVSPGAVEHYKRLCGIYGGPEMSAKVTLVPHPVEGRFSFCGNQKRERVVCVGRWSDETQKRTRLMMTVLERLLIEEPVEVEIAGTSTDGLAAWHNALPAELRDRVKIRGRLGRNELAELYLHARILYSSSAFESFGIAAAEALCSGCTVVAARLVSMGSFDWFTRGGGGTLADVDNLSGHVEALRQELAKWRRAERDPIAISGLWGPLLHERAVAERVVSLIR